MSLESVAKLSPGRKSKKPGKEKMDTQNNKQKNNSLNGLRLRFLSHEQVKQIDETLASIGEYGEIHLVVQHGELRYVNKVESVKAWKNNVTNK